MKCTTCGQENPSPCNHSKPGATLGVTRSKVRIRPLSHTSNRVSWKLVAISLAVGIVGGGAFLLFASLRAQEKMEARGFFDRTVTIPPGYSQDYHLTSLVSGRYELDVSAHEGPVIVACGMLENPGANKIDPKELARILESGVRVEAGKRHRMSGDHNRGTFFWTVVNPSSDKTVDVTIRFAS